jgi:hypothetical protein
MASNRKLFKIVSYEKKSFKTGHETLPRIFTTFSFIKIPLKFYKCKINFFKLNPEYKANFNE